MEWLLAQLDQMRADALAGKRPPFPEDRETILKRMGFAFGDYQTYLSSSLWGRIRRRILKRDNHACVRCSDKATQVHHLSYTEAVLKGEDDTQVVSVCAQCHDQIEFQDPDKKSRRSEKEKQRVLEDREGARQEKSAAMREKISAEQERLRQQELKERVRGAAGGRCFRCEGDTEGHTEWPFCPRDGGVYLIPVNDGEPVEVWACSPCSSNLDHDKQERLRTDEEKLKLLRKKVNIRYARPTPSTEFSQSAWPFRTRGEWLRFRQLNAMQREGIMNEFEWNAANITDPDLETSDPVQFQALWARFESTRANGRSFRGRH